MPSGRRKRNMSPGLFPWYDREKVNAGSSCPPLRYRRAGSVVEAAGRSHTEQARPCRRHFPQSARGPLIPFSLSGQYESRRKAFFSCRSRREGATRKTRSAAKTGSMLSREEPSEISRVCFSYIVETSCRTFCPPILMEGANISGTVCVSCFKR